MEELNSSELGTLEYWENRYGDELSNFKSHGNIGEVWFGENISAKIINWIRKHVDKTSAIVDIGCGNGHILMELANEGYENLYGIDFSEQAINLARSINNSENCNFNIKYDLCNILEDLPGIYDVIHDKGTYDAICLSSCASENRTKYLLNVKKALKNSGFFIITTCNWTVNEITEQFKEYFTLAEVIPTKQFQFGGQSGNIVSVGIFKKK